MGFTSLSGFAQSVLWSRRGEHSFSQLELMLFSTSQAGDVGSAWLPRAQWEPGWGSTHIWRKPVLAHRDKALTSSLT